LKVKYQKIVHTFEQFGTKGIKKNIAKIQSFSQVNGEHKKLHLFNTLSVQTKLIKK